VIADALDLPGDLGRLAGGAAPLDPVFENDIILQSGRFYLVEIDRPDRRRWVGIRVGRCRCCRISDIELITAGAAVVVRPGLKVVDAGSLGREEDARTEGALNGVGEQGSSAVCQEQAWRGESARSAGCLPQHGEDVRLPSNETDREPVLISYRLDAAEL
jgi:hypothetical protein